MRISAPLASYYSKKKNFWSKCWHSRRWKLYCGSDRPTARTQAGQNYWQLHSSHYRAWSYRLNTHSAQIHVHPPYRVENSSAVEPITPSPPSSVVLVNESLFFFISVVRYRLRFGVDLAAKWRSLYPFSRLFPAGYDMCWKRSQLGGNLLGGTTFFQTSTFEVLNRRRRLSQA